MPSTKRYTNLTFTKRVDHEAGRHRPLRAAPEPAVCGRCGSRYEGRRWVSPAVVASRRGPARGRVRDVICPACKQIASGLPSGFLSIGGAFVMIHRGDIEQLLRNEAARAALDNPLGRIMTWEPKADGFVVTTTTEHLAQRLGHALEKAYGGTVVYDFSHENKVARVAWRRD